MAPTLTGMLDESSAIIAIIILDDPELLMRLISFLSSLSRLGGITNRESGSVGSVGSAFLTFSRNEFT
jgi:hypothetical protein